MNEKCRNDCARPLAFPSVIYNRPGLPKIAYRIGTYADFREAIVRALDLDDALAGWTHRKPDDPGIALLEGASVLGDILTFYQEVYANEAYLRTARWRESVADLVRLLGYRLAPGLGGRGTFAFKVKGDDLVVIPAGFPVKAQLEGQDQNSEFETVEEATAYPALSAFSLYRPPALNNITTGTNAFSVLTATLEEHNLTLGGGDRLLLAVDPSMPTTKRQVVVVDEAEVRFDRTEIRIEGSWQQGDAGKAVKAYKIGRTFRHLGYNGPSENVRLTSDGEKAIPEKVDFDRRISGVSGARLMPLSAEVDDLSVGAFFLVLLQLKKPPSQTPMLQLAFGQLEDASNVVELSTIFAQAQPSAVEAGLAPLREAPAHFFERAVSRVFQESGTLGAVSGGTTVVELDAELGFGDLGFTDIRSVEFLEIVGPPLTLKNAYAEAPASDPGTLYVFCPRTVYERLEERRLMFVKEDGTQEILTAGIDQQQVQANDAARLRPVYLPAFEEEFRLDDFPLLDEPTVTVYGNVVEATEGKTEREAVLGNGDGRQIFQTFKLPKAPLTYLHSVGATPPEVPELTIYVEDRLWMRASTFFGRGPDEEIYVVREDDEDNGYVQFGDGKTGKRLPSGLRNVKAVFRTGTGAFGKIEKDAKAQAGARLKRLDKIQLPGVISGGSARENGQKAREAAPGKIQSLGRLVSRDDFESEALALAGVSRARAAWRLVENVPEIVVTVLMDTGRGAEFSEIEEILRDYNRCRGAGRHSISVEQGLREYVALAADVALDPSFRQDVVETAVHEALGLDDGAEDDGAEDEGAHGLFALRNLRFGQNAYATKIAGTIQSVEGVRWTKVTGLVSLGPSETPSELSLPEVFPPLAPPEYVLPCPPSHVLSLHRVHLRLNFVATEPLTPC